MNPAQEQPTFTTAAPVVAPAAASWSPDQLVDALNALDVPFLAGGTGAEAAPELEPAALLAGLAASDEARLRLAVIPLLLRRPELAAFADDALARMPADACLGFRCFYTAAVFLQQKHRTRLEELFGALPALPECYSLQLGVNSGLPPDEALAALAEKQQEASGRYLNWRATYERGAEMLLVFSQARRQWVCSTPA